MKLFVTKRNTRLDFPTTVSPSNTTLSSLARDASPAPTLDNLRLIRDDDVITRGDLVYSLWCPIIVIEGGEGNRQHGGGYDVISAYSWDEVAAERDEEGRQRITYLA